MHKYKDLQVWQKSIELTTEVYAVTGTFPQRELYGLIAQINRCAVSVPSNIAEGAGRNSNGEFVQFLGIANGSAYELETQLIIANRLNFISNESLDAFTSKLNEIQKMIFKMQNVLKSK